MNIDGRKRVIIERVFPEIDCGIYPIRRVPGEKVSIKSFVISDGHDMLTVILRYRHETDSDWTDKELTLLYNDEWIGEFITEKKGLYTYTVRAWVDSYKTWRSGLIKKIDAGLNVSVELRIGEKILREASERARDGDAGILADAADRLTGIDGEYKTVYEDHLIEKIAARYPEPELVSYYGKELRVFVERNRALFSAWYEMFPRSSSGDTAKHGTFRDCEKILPEIKDMGFNIIYFPPIHPVGEKNRKGKNNELTAGKDDFGSPWAIGSRHGGHKTVNPLLGTMEDFERLVKKTDSMDLEIALDMAFHCAPDHPYLAEHPDWFKWLPDKTIQYAENPPKKYEDIVPFNFECEDWMNLWEELKSVFTFWIDKGINIFRVDNPHTKPFAFWEWVIGEIKKDHPDVIFLAEAFTRPKMMYRLAKSGFTQSYTYFTWRNTKQEIEEYMHELTRGESREYLFPNFWPNTPDILHEYIQHGGRSACIIRLILAATLSSNYGIYGGAYITCQTEPFPGKEEYNNNEKYELKNWNLDAPDSIKKEVTIINRIRNQNPALQSTWNLDLRLTSNPEILFYVKATADLSNVIMIAVNLDPFRKQSGFVSVPLAEIGLHENLEFFPEDQLTGNRFKWKGEWNYVELDPAIIPAHIMKLTIY
jgi:starch synthase (maltosyl-transferring)